jgi:protein O-mannosyl-transferase
MTSPSLRSQRWLALGALCVLTLLAYANSFGGGFAMDNRGLLLEDPRIREATTEHLEQIVRHTYWWPYGESGLYRPFTTLTYLFNYAVLGGGADATGYHWINFLLHLGNALLVFTLVRRLGAKLWPGFFMAAVWAVHPVLTESVTNMVGRADLLAGMALLGGLLLYLKSAEAAGGRRWAWLAGLLAVTAVGVFSKENAATVVGVIALFELVRWKWPDAAAGPRRGGALLLGCLAVMLPIQAMLYLRGAALAGLPPTDFPYCDNPLVGADFWTARLTALQVMGRYIALLVWPAVLSCDYSIAAIPFAHGSAADWFYWSVVAVAAAALVPLWRHGRMLFFAVAAAFLTFLPTSNLIVPIGTIMAERFLYLPAIAAAACVVAAVYGGLRRLGAVRLAPVVLGLLVAALAARTWVRNTDWHDELTLATATVKTSPGSFKSHRMLASALFGADGGERDIDRVIAEGEQAAAILDRVPDARNNPDVYRRAAAYWMSKCEQLPVGGADGPTAAPPAAVPVYRRVVELLQRSRRIVLASDVRLGAAGPDERVAELDRMLATTWLRLGDASKSRETAEAALRLQPLTVASYERLASALVAGGRAEEAVVVLMRGAMVTADAGLRQGFVDLYQHGVDSSGCATRPGGAHGPMLNPACPLVSRHLCMASAAVIRLRLEMGRRDLAEKLKGEALREFGCSAAALDVNQP